MMFTVVSNKTLQSLISAQADSKERITNLFYLGFYVAFNTTGHITTGSWKGRGNQYIQFARVAYCKLPTNGKQLPAFPLKAVTGIEPRPQRWEARVLPLCHRGPPAKQKLLLQDHRLFHIFVIYNGDVGWIIAVELD